MKTLNNPSPSTWPDIFKRPEQSIEQLDQTVSQIFKEVKDKGEKAVLKYTSLFDGIELTEIRVKKEELVQAGQQLSHELKEAIGLAKSNIEKFHMAQKTKPVMIETSPGVLCWQEKKPINKVGLYIPGGTAPLFSTVLMLAVPANLAGCKEVILCSPPNKLGQINPAILYTAHICGISQIYKVGGIQAIAAMCFGTENISSVYKIFGPGNQYVTAAKQAAIKFGVAIDMPAGPSELLIVADDTARADFVAADLLSQAEHGTDSQVLLLSSSAQLITEVEKEIKLQLKVLPRKKIAQKVMENAKLILVKDDKTALKMINQYAPEHLIIIHANETIFTKGIENAGSVFIGNYSPESAGDYASGTNHTLPTNGFSKAYSGVNLDSFLKSMTFQKISKVGIKNIGNSVEEMANTEGLFAHKNAVSLRLKQLKDEKI